MLMNRRTVRSTAARALVAMAAFVTVAGCATKSDIRDIQTELRSIAVRQDSLISQLREETLSTQDTLRTQADQLFDFRGEVMRLLRDISQGMATLQALAGENQRGIAGVRDQLANVRGQPTAAGPGGAPSNTGGGSGEAVGGAGGNADQLWQVATGQFSRGSLSTAQRAFEQFLREYPNHERAPDARFFLADILAQQDRPEDALEAFRAIPELYPTAPKVPEALYRIAVIQLEMGETAAARETLRRIINTYPESAIALIARDKLEEIP